MVIVTVICPLYNKEIYLSRTIESVISQTYADWELIIVDDGSTDRSIEIAKSYQKDNPKIRILYRKDYSINKRGANICRNIGLFNSSGKYALFLDADDLLLPHCLKQRIEMVHKMPGFSFYVFNVAYCKGQDALPYDKLHPTRSDIRSYKCAKDKRIYFLKKFLKFDLPWHTSGPIWDKKFLLEKGGLNEDFQRLQDPELHTRMLLDSSTKLKYLMDETNFDVLHRKDDDRVVWDNEEFFKKQFNSIVQFIDYFTPILEVRQKKLKKFMQGYLLEVEKLVYRYLRDNYSKDLQIVLTNEMTKFYANSSVIAICDLKFKIFKNILNLMKYKIFYKWKVLGIMIWLYKKVI